MTVELVLLLSIFAFMVLGAFLGPNGPVQTFKNAAPRLAARVERNISTGDGFRNCTPVGGMGCVNWTKPTTANSQP